MTFKAKVQPELSDAEIDAIARVLNQQEDELVDWLASLPVAESDQLIAHAAGMREKAKKQREQERLRRVARQKELRR